MMRPLPKTPRSSDEREAAAGSSARLPDAAEPESPARDAGAADVPLDDDIASLRGDIERLQQYLQDTSRETME